MLFQYACVVGNFDAGLARWNAREKKRHSHAMIYLLRSIRLGVALQFMKRKADREKLRAESVKRRRAETEPDLESEEEEDQGDAKESPGQKSGEKANSAERGRVLQWAQGAPSPGSLVGKQRLLVLDFLKK